jgi:predicted RNase H-like HicB family nuclease
MMFSGRVYKDDKFWLAEIPIIDAMTQGNTREHALEMVADMLETMVNKKELQVEIISSSDDKFEIGSQDSNALTAFLAQRKQEITGSNDLEKEYTSYPMIQKAA